MHTATNSQKTKILAALADVARHGYKDLKAVAELPLTFSAIMRVVDDTSMTYITDNDRELFRILLHKARRTPTHEKMLRHVAACREGVPAMMEAIMRDAQSPTIRVQYHGSSGDSEHVRALLKQAITKVDVPTDSNGMCYPKPNGGKRILPSIYTRIKKWWMRANGVTVEVVDMNDGHLENTMKLLQESHGNVIAKSTELLGKMANHFHNQPAVVQQLEDLCMAMQKVEVDAMYPIFKELATEAAQRKATPAMLVAVNPAWFEDGELNWGDK